MFTSCHVKDLGAAPGGWSVVASKYLDKTKGGLLIGIDLLPYQPVDSYPIITGDFSSIFVQEKISSLLQSRLADVVMSDMLHNTTGQKAIDHDRSMELVNDALTFCDGTLKRNGYFFAKFLKGHGDKLLFERTKRMFADIKLVKPKASRAESNEMYILCIRKK